METDDDGPTLGLHLGMAGAIAVDEPPASRGWDRFTLAFDDGGRLALRDKRRLGRAVLEPGLLATSGRTRRGVGRAAFRERVGRGPAPVKARLLDQGAIAGVGNLLADETLWRARLPPRRAAGELTDDELDRLRRAVRAATRDAIRHGGVHTGDVRRRARARGRLPALRPHAGPRDAGRADHVLVSGLPGLSRGVGVLGLLGGPADGLRGLVVAQAGAAE